MKTISYFILIISIAFLTVFFVKSSVAQEDEPDVGTKFDVIEVEDIEIKPNPQRFYCAKYWDSVYEKRKEKIEVSTRGKYDEIVIFNCPDCSLEEEYVEPFLNDEYNGVTGLDRIRECGFVIAVFRGAQGIREIVREVPQ